MLSLVVAELLPEAFGRDSLIAAGVGVATGAGLMLALAATLGVG